VRLKLYHQALNSNQADILNRAACIHVFAKVYDDDDDVCA